MCIACELGYWSMMDALPPEVRERILRQQESSGQFACDAPANPPQSDAQNRDRPATDEPKP